MSWTRAAARCAAVLLLPWIAPALGGDASRTPALEATREAYVRLLEAEQACAVATTDPRGDLSGATMRRSAAEQSFVAAFSRVDWGAWDAEADRALLVRGLDAWADREETGGRFDGAVRAYEFLLERAAASDVARRVRWLDLPRALLCMGELPAAVAAIDVALVHLAPVEQAFALLEQAAVHAALGDYQAAQAAVVEARSRFAARLEAGSVADEETCLRFNVASQRAAVLGSPAPAVEFQRAVGTPASWARLAGRPTVLFLLRPGERDDWPRLTALDRLQQSLEPQGLRVVAVTSYERVAAEPGSDLEGHELDLPVGTDGRPGERMRVTRDGLPLFLEQFRSRLRLRLTLAIAREDALRPYVDRPGQTSLVVLDREQRIANLSTSAPDAAWAGLVRAVCAR